ncbi:MAG TPA: YeeE/YedE thiosulfate transporter family protein [Candidatus Methylomirabilis sp.]|nr:YeeE/YedE thiosulfate transporter family protein [Candidatus Methylomirabilis sp.]
MNRFVRPAAMAAFGFALGVALSRLGFTDWTEVHAMFTMGLLSGGPSAATLRLLFAFCGAVGLAFVGFAAFARRDAIPSRPIHKGTVAGGLLFGLGWGLTGGCPSIAVVQLGEGRLAAGASVAGVLVGTWLTRRLAARFDWRTSTCD